MARAIRDVGARERADALGPMEALVEKMGYPGLYWQVVPEDICEEEQEVRAFIE